MLQFVCDYCGDIKHSGETWISGMAAENVGTKAARREVIIDPVWRYERAVAPLAVHFCSLDCKDSYMAKLFDKPAALLEIERVQVQPATGARTVRARKKPITSSVRKRTVSRKKRVV